MVFIVSCNLLTYSQLASVFMSANELKLLWAKVFNVNRTTDAMFNLPKQPFVKFSCFISVIVIFAANISVNNNYDYVLLYVDYSVCVCVKYNNCQYNRKVAVIVKRWHLVAAHHQQKNNQSDGDYWASSNKTLVYEYSQENEGLNAWTNTRQMCVFEFAHKHLPVLPIIILFGWNNCSHTWELV